VFVCQLLAFLAWPKALPNSLIQSFEATRTYGVTSNFSDPTLPNYSIGRGLNGFLSSLGIFKDPSEIQIIVLALVVLIGFAVFLMKEKVSDFSSLVFLGTASSFSVNITWGYYAIIPLLFVFLLLNFSTEIAPRLIVYAHYVVAFGAAITLSRIIIVAPQEGFWIPLSNSTTIGLMWFTISGILVIAEYAAHLSRRRIEA
jgi:hypothetical protein